MVFTTVGFDVGRNVGGEVIRLNIEIVGTRVGGILLATVGGEENMAHES